MVTAKCTKQQTCILFVQKYKFVTRLELSHIHIDIYLLCISNSEKISGFWTLCFSIGANINTDSVFLHDKTALMEFFKNKIKLSISFCLTGVWVTPFIAYQYCLYIFRKSFSSLISFLLLIIRSVLAISSAISSGVMFKFAAICWSVNIFRIALSSSFCGNCTSCKSFLSFSNTLSRVLTWSLFDKWQSTRFSLQSKILQSSQYKYRLFDETGKHRKSFGINSISCFNESYIEECWSAQHCPRKLLQSKQYFTAGSLSVQSWHSNNGIDRAKQGTRCVVAALFASEHGPAIYYYI